MKKLKLNFQHLGNAEVLTRSQLKQIMGGFGGSGGGTLCWTTDQCPINEKCSYSDIGEQGTCVTVSLGTSCSTDYDCGAGQKCTPFAPPLQGKFCGPKVI